MPKSKTDHESTKVRKREKIHNFGVRFRTFVLSYFRDPPRFWLGIGNPTANPVALRKSYGNQTSIFEGSGI